MLALVPGEDTALDEIFDFWAGYRIGRIYLDPACCGGQPEYRMQKRAQPIGLGVSTTVLRA